MKLTAFETFQTYLALKNHFTSKKYDFIKYHGKVKASNESFIKRKDRIWFEKISRKKNKQEIIEFFVSNFVINNDLKKVWIGDIIKNGQTNYLEWKKRIQSLTYNFKSEINLLLEKHTFKELFKVSEYTHPIIIKEFLKKNITLETLVILNKLLKFTDKFNSKINDPIWKELSLKIDKYSIFLDVELDKYKKILLDIL